MLGGRGGLGGSFGFGGLIREGLIGVGRGERACLGYGVQGMAVPPVVALPGSSAAENGKPAGGAVAGQRLAVGRVLEQYEVA